MPKASTSKATSGTKAPAKKPAVKRKANGYQTPENIPLGEILTDLSKQQWKIGPSIGSGGFGAIYCATKANESTKKYDDYSYVVKVEPHGNGPLFVEMHFYMRNGKLSDIDAFRKKRGVKSLGMPHFLGHGSHELNGKKHRFLVMPRFGADIWSLFLKNGRQMPLHTVYRLAIQMLDVYEYIHESTYAHADLKGTNMLLGHGGGGSSQVYLVDFGLASHYTTKDFKPDPKKMHNGTIEYTSRDAHQGVPTMRGDFEILAYNLIQWAGGELPWEKSNLLGSPPKVQQAKEDFMSNISTQLKSCFGKKECPEPILAYLQFVTKLKYDEKPSYDKCRKFFSDGLKALGKSNSGHLEFSTASTSVQRAEATTTSKDTRPKTSRVSARAPKENTENISPKTQSSRKRNTEDDTHKDTPSPIKKSRDSSRKRSTQRSTQASAKSSPMPDSSIVVNNHINDAKTKKSKTYNLNFELDISFDANVVVNVKRKPKKAKVEPKSPNDSIRSTDEIPSNEKSFIFQSIKVSKKRTRTSPRSK